MGTELILLGTGTPNPDPDRAGSAAAVIVAGQAYLIDAGPGVVRRAAAAAANGVSALEMPGLTHLFITHLHSDHTAGLADLLLTPWVLERNQPLQIFGPPGTAQMVDHLLAAYEADINERLHGLEPANPLGYTAIVQEIAPGLIYEDANVTVWSFLVRHGSWPAFGYRFVTAAGTVVISGDTAPYDGMVADYAGADLLLHEVYSSVKWAQRPSAWQEYHAAVHTSTTQLAAIARQVCPSKLILTHQLFWGATEAELVAEIKAGYDGVVISGRDLQHFTLH